VHLSSVSSCRARHPRSHQRQTTMIKLQIDEKTAAE
jgi:hypothetical protein